VSRCTELQFSGAGGSIKRLFGNACLSVTFTVAGLWVSVCTTFMAGPTRTTSVFSISAPWNCRLLRRSCLRGPRLGEGRRYQQQERERHQYQCEETFEHARIVRGFKHSAQPVVYLIYDRETTCLKRDATSPDSTASTDPLGSTDVRKDMGRNLTVTAIQCMSFW
jgi:hypothetical protein